MSVPVCAMVTPDLVEASDAGRAGWYACCRRGRTAGETVGCGARSPPPLPSLMRRGCRRRGCNRAPGRSCWRIYCRTGRRWTVASRGGAAPCGRDGGEGGRAAPARKAGGARDFGDAVRTVAAGVRYDGPVKGQVNYAGGCHRGSRTRSSSGSTCGTATTTTTWGSTTGPSTTRTFLVSFRRGLFFSSALFDLTDRDTTRSCVL